MNERQRHHRCGKVIQVGRHHKHDEHHHPKQLFAVTSSCPYTQEVETAVIVQYLYDGHRGQQEENDLASLTHITQKDGLSDKLLHSLTGVCHAVKIVGVGLLVHQLHEIRSIGNIQHPPHCTKEYCYSGSIHICNILCANENKTNDYD